MTLSKISILAIAFVLLAFIGQSVATAKVPCLMNMQITSPSNPMQMDSGAQLTHGDMDSSFQSDECEDIDMICTCPMKGGASMVLVTNLTPSDSVKVSSMQIVSNIFSIKTPTPTTNYRPPKTC